MVRDGAYAAGLLDGEGCILIGVRKATYRARVNVGMTLPALPLLQSMQAEWGGGLSRSRVATERHAESWMWSLQGAPAAVLLEAALPHLRLKRPQAELALAVEAIRTSLPRWRNGSGLWTPEARAERAALKEKMHALNVRGPRATTVEVA